LRVYDGQALVTDGDRKLTAKKGREVELAADLASKNFDVNDTDAFYRWSGRRTGYIAAANVTSAHVASDSGYGSGFFGGRSAWSWNPYFGMFTFIPSTGIYQSPFGSPFYSPAMIRFVYVPRMAPSPIYMPGSNPGMTPASMGAPTMSAPSMGASSLGASSAPRLAAPSGPPAGAGGGMISPRSMPGGRLGR
jgi:hypothetical protein